MDYFQVILLGVIQGLTEFFPVSSSGHLILIPHLFNFKDQGLGIHAILHLGTAIAMVLYFREDLVRLVRALFNRNDDPDYHQLAWNIGWATFPAVVIGMIWGDLIEQELRNSTFVAWNLLFWSFVLLAAQRYSSNQTSTESDISKMTLGQILFIGCAQAIAFFPGTSRSSITIIGGLLTKLSPTASVRFSFLLGAPIIFAAGAKKTLDYLSEPPLTNGLSITQLGIGLFVSFTVGYFAIKVLFEIVSRVGLMPFVIYRVLIATFILVFF